MMNKQREELEKELKSLVGHSMGWQSVEEDTHKSYDDLKKDFIEMMFNKFNLDVINKISLKTTSNDDLTRDSGEINIDTGVLYLFLMKTNTIEIQEYDDIEKKDIRECKYLLILLESKEPRKARDKAIELLTEYTDLCKDIICSLKKSDKESQTIIRMD